MAVRFYCGADSSEGKPVLQSYDAESCTHNLEWHSPIACDDRYVYGIVRSF